MKNNLLACIAFHYSEDRLQYLNKVIDNLLSYDCPVTIIVDTNNPDLKLSKPVIICPHIDLAHPFHLTCMHRKHIKDNIGKYDNYMYVEDDELIPYENYLNYIENFKLLYPKYVPSFVRIEYKDKIEYISDVPEKQPKEIIKVDDKEFISFKFPFSYHGFWIMPGKELKEVMNDDFCKLTDGREFAAMFVGWGLQKQPLLELENGLISKKCYSYHLPSNYALGNGPNGKIEPKNIFL